MRDITTEVGAYYYSILRFPLVFDIARAFAWTFHQLEPDETFTQVLNNEGFSHIQQPDCALALTSPDNRKVIFADNARLKSEVVGYRRVFRHELGHVFHVMLTEAGLYDENALDACKAVIPKFAYYDVSASYFEVNDDVTARELFADLFHTWQCKRVWYRHNLRELPPFRFFNRAYRQLKAYYLYDMFASEPLPLTDKDLFNKVA